MSNPIDPIQVPVPEPVYKTTKAVWATVTTVAGLLALIIKCIADGGVGSGEIGELIIGAATAVAAISTVWGFSNEVKRTR
jgi:hypothetical protein